MTFEEDNSNENDFATQNDERQAIQATSTELDRLTSPISPISKNYTETIETPLFQNSPISIPLEDNSGEDRRTKYGGGGGMRGGDKEDRTITMVSIGVGDGMVHPMNDNNMNFNNDELYHLRHDNNNSSSRSSHVVANNEKYSNNVNTVGDWTPVEVLIQQQQQRQFQEVQNNTTANIGQHQHQYASPTRKQQYQFHIQQQQYNNSNYHHNQAWHNQSQTLAIPSPNRTQQQFQDYQESQQQQNHPIVYNLNQPFHPKKQSNKAMRSSTTSNNCYDKNNNTNKNSYAKIMKHQSTQSMTFQQRIQMECSNNYHFFSIIEDYDYNTINIQKSFAPALPTLMALVLRTYWLAISIFFTYQDFHIETSNNGHDYILFFSHYTNITMIFTIIYQITSCFLTFVASTQSCFGKRKHHYILYQPLVVKPPLGWSMGSSGDSYVSDVKDDNTNITNAQDQYGDEESIPLVVQSQSIHHDRHRQQQNIHLTHDTSIHSTSLSTIYSAQRYDSTSPTTSSANIGNNSINPCTRPTVLVCLNWLLYMIVLPAELTVAIGYFLYEFNPNEDTLEYTNLYKHGIIALLLLIDGNIIGRIPLRIKHFFAVLMHITSYGMYTIYFSYSYFGSRHHNGFIYNNFNWKDDRDSSVHMAIEMVCIITPLSFAFCYLFSLASFGMHGLGVSGRESMSSHGLGGGYCCWYNICRCFSDIFCGFSFDGSRRILYEPEHNVDADGNNQHITGNDNERCRQCQHKIILSQPWKRERSRLGSGRKRSPKRSVFVSNKKDKVAQSVSSSIASTQYQHHFAHPNDSQYQTF